MGKYEDELRQIVSEGSWSAPKATAMDHALISLEIAISDMSQLHQDSWSGESANAARAAYATVREDFRNLRNDLEKVDRIFNAARPALEAAAQCVGGLPSTVFPKEIQDAMDFAASNKNPFIVVRGVSFVVDSGMHAISSFFGNHKEDEAKKALETLRSDLQRLSDMLPPFPTPPYPRHDRDRDRLLRNREIPIPDPVVPDPIPTPTPHYNGGIGGGTLPTGGGYVPSPGGSGGSGGSGGYPLPGSGGSGGLAGPGPVLSVDDGSTGYMPGGSGGSSGLGAFALGGGSAAAAAALRARTAGGFGGGGGLGSPVTGTGGILGSGTGSGAGGSGGAGASGTGAGAAGGRGGMMGGGGAGAGKTDKAKRAGMGGAIAPKFEDDPEYTPLPEGARAGRRATKDPATDNVPRV